MLVSFERPGGIVAVQTDDQHVAQRAGSFQVIQVTDVQDVEQPIGKDDPFPGRSLLLSKFYGLSQTQTLSSNQLSIMVQSPPLPRLLPQLFSTSHLTGSPSRRSTPMNAMPWLIVLSR